MKLTIALSNFALLAFAGCPMANMRNMARQIPNLPLSQEEGNSGPIPSTGFDAVEQLIKVGPGSGHRYQAPSSGDKRGPCPGLNAAANHGFLPRNGLPTIAQTVSGLAAAYGFGQEFAAALAVIAITLTGDPVGQKWSIGGPFTPALGGLRSNPVGISYSHNTYECDASIVRQDAYLNNGDASSLIISQFQSLLSKANSDGEFTIDILRQHNKQKHDYSINNNPYFFQAPFAGLVPPIAHHFVINLMSNHSADRPQGFLTKEVLKSFFAVSGSDSAPVWYPGQERIPDNWYRRPSSNPYDAARAGADVAILATRFPDVVRFGGNTGTPNSFVGIDVGDVTSGVYNAQTLLQGNNALCFAFQAAKQAIPSALEGFVLLLILAASMHAHPLQPICRHQFYVDMLTSCCKLLQSVITPILTLVNNNINPVLSQLACPALTQFNQSAFNQYPGATYKPLPP